MKGGRARYTYNYGGLEWTTIESPQPLAPGKHTIRYEFTWGGGAPGTGGTGKLLVDGKPAGEKTINKMMPYVYSADEGADVGLDAETPVTNEYKQGDNAFTGRIIQVTAEATPPAAN
jgi:arylsulfatase